MKAFHVGLWLLGLLAGCVALGVMCGFFAAAVLVPMFGYGVGMFALFPLCAVSGGVFSWNWIDYGWRLFGE